MQPKQPVFSVSFSLLFALACSFPLAAASRAQQSAGDFAMTRAQFWSRPFGTDPRIPLAGDTDGDGHADLISLWPQGGGVIDLSRTSPLGKPIYGNQARTDFGNNAIAVACGPFARTTPRVDVLALFADGSVRIAHDMSPGTNRYLRDDLVATIPPQSPDFPTAPVRTAVADFDGDGRADVLLLGGNGHLLLLQNQGGDTPHFASHSVVDVLTNVRQLSAGNLGGGGTDRRSRLVWLDAKGQVHRAALEFGPAKGSSSSVHLSAAVTVLTTSPDEHLVVGRFRGQKEADLLIGQRLLPGGDPTHAQILPGLPTRKEAQGDVPWIAADFDGNGKDDLLRFHRSNEERFSGQDTFIHFSYAPGSKESPGYFSTANDGLPDIWKTGKVHPGGLDLAALGCRVGHQDLLVEVQRYEDVSLEELRRVTSEATRYFATLPTRNPDGSHGIALHILLVEPPNRLADRERILREFDKTYPPLAHRGVTHWMSVEHHLGVATFLGDSGHADPITGVFVHELGHQIGLEHDGHWGIMNSPLYHSMMGFLYPYTNLDDPNNVGYSAGEFAAVVLREPHLSERLPFPMERLRFLAGAPYHFHLQPGSDPNTTLVDWNWNGVLGEEDVAADINYSPGIALPPRTDLGKTQTAPALVAHRAGKAARLLAFYGMGQAGQSGSGLAPGNPGSLLLRYWQGANRDTEAARWSEPQAVEASGVIGDPTATFLGNRTWVAYPTDSGVVVRGVSMDGQGQVQVGSPTQIPNSQGAQPTLATIAGRLLLLLWRGPDQPIGMQFLSTEGEVASSGREASLGIMSRVPPAAVAGAEASSADGGADLWLARQQGIGETHFAGRTEVCQFALDPASSKLHIKQREWIDGNYASYRMTLLWRAEAGLGSRGRLYHLGGGITTPEKPWAEQFITMNVPYRDIGGGWFYRRYAEDSLTSRSAPGACWFQGSLVYALRQHDANPERNDTLALSFYGDGVVPTPMGDFDDIGLIHDYGLSRSIPSVVQ